MDLNIQTIFYILSPIGTFAAVLTAYYAVYKQTKPSIRVYYEVSPDTATVIDLVIKNIGNGSARDIKFSENIAIYCWGIDIPDNNEVIFLDEEYEIPVLSPNSEIRFIGGQYAGIENQIKQKQTIKATYKFDSPLNSNKIAKDISFLTVKHMKYQSTKNSAAQDISDAFTGRNNTVFSEMNLRLEQIEKALLNLKQK